MFATNIRLIFEIAVVFCNTGEESDRPRPLITKAGQICLSREKNGALIEFPETLYHTVVELGLVPFFENLVPGYSIEEHTPPQFWFDGE